MNLQPQNPMASNILQHPELQTHQARPEIEHSQQDTRHHQQEAYNPLQQDEHPRQDTEQETKQETQRKMASQALERHRIQQGIFHTIYWTPPWCRWSVENPPPFTIWLNILYGIAGGFTTANLSYSYPILNVLADDFHTSQAGVANIPTLAQAGNVTGLLFLLPLADFFPRRQFVLTLVFFAAAFWIGLCITSNLSIFLALTYLSAIFTGSSQIMLPLVAELSTPEKRAFNLSIVSGGPTLGILLARILSGIVTNYTTWRNIYWLALGLQGCVFSALWLLMPDYPATNPTSVKNIAKDYPKILCSIVTLYLKHPILVQSALISLCTFFVVTSYWTTLTFLLAGPPYYYNSLDIGLVGLAGLATMVLAPLYSKVLIEPLREPIFPVIIGNTINLVGTIIGTYTGTLSAAGPVLQALLLDAGLIIISICNRVAIHPVAPLARNRVNTAFVSMLYVGQLTGTKAGNEIYEKYGGWIASGSLSIGVIVFVYAIIALRGPYEKRWVGWHGGWRLRPKQMDDNSGDTQASSAENVDLRTRERADSTLSGIDKFAHLEAQTSRS